MSLPVCAVEYDRLPSDEAGAEGQEEQLVVPQVDLRVRQGRAKGQRRKLVVLAGNRVTWM